MQSNNHSIGNIKMINGIIIYLKLIKETIYKMKMILAHIINDDYTESSYLKLIKEDIIYKIKMTIARFSAPAQFDISGGATLKR